MPEHALFSFAKLGEGVSRYARHLVAGSALCWKEATLCQILATTVDVATLPEQGGHRRM